jgi:putative transposase
MLVDRRAISLYHRHHTNHGHKLLAVGGMPDHVHIFFGMRPTEPLSDLMQAVKGDSSKWINENRLTLGRFSWQEGYGAFSYSKSQVASVVQYVFNQEAHHRTKTFIEEYHEFLPKFGVDFEERYTFAPDRCERSVRIERTTNYILTRAGLLFESLEPA